MLSKDQFLISRVLDAGGRYGLHPSWKPFTGELDYYLFEPDPAKAMRLEQKYSHRSNEIKVVDKAVTKEDGTLTINFFRNRAMSSSVSRAPLSASFHGEREQEVDIVDKIECPAVSIDSFCNKNKLKLDFIKLDTEGTEFAILEGAQKQLENIMGVRCEVAFDKIFEGMPMFGDIHELLIDKGFYLLNLDYEGRGDYQNDFVNVNERYGILTSTDGVWLRRQDDLEKNETQYLKYAAFCLCNNAPDVALDALFRGKIKYELDYSKVESSRLYRFVDISIQKLFYSLKWQPGQSLKQSQDAYLEIFGKKMKEMNHFMESIELNPD
jgi:FkbM family methyltransferase